MMVLIAARAEGRRLPRAERTKDVDVLIDVCVHPEGLTKAADVLSGFGYEQPQDAWCDGSVARCTFVSGMVQIDLLGPDDSDPAKPHNRERGRQPGYPRRAPSTRDGPTGPNHL
jgi:hypothetical protein